MSGFDECLTNAVAEGAVTKEQAERIGKDYRERRQAYGDLDPEGAIRAAQEAFDAFDFEAARRKRLRVLTVQKQQKILFDVRKHRDENGTLDPKQGGLALLDSTTFQGNTIGANALYQSLRGRFHRTIDTALLRFSRSITGETRNKADLDAMTDQLFSGRFSSDATGEMAQAVAEALEQARVLFNKAGGAIPKLDRYGVPQVHDEQAILDAGFEAWRDALLPLLDRERMIDGHTGLRLSDERLELALRDTFEAIRTDGWSRREASGAVDGRAVANRRLEHRFLHFKDGAAWRAYHEQFGAGDSWSAVMGYLDSMARDIALMQRFGPNPMAGLRYAQDIVNKAAGDSGDRLAMRRADAATDDMETMFLHMTGTVNRPTRPRTALVFGTVRQFLVATQLGSAMLSAVGDINFGRLTAKYNGMAGLSVIKRQVSLLNPSNAADRKAAIRMGLIAEEASTILSAANRYLDTVHSHEVTQRLADATLRVSGLSAWTQAGRWAFGMEFLGMMADQSGKAFSELPAPFQRTLRRYGLEGSWEVARRQKMMTHKGADFLDPANFEDMDLGSAFLSMVRSETEFAVPSVSLYGRSVFGGRERPGSVGGELIRSGLMYKSFSVTMATTHGRRMMKQPGLAGKAGYAATLVGGATLLGALSLQLKDISKGREPRDMQNGKFIMAAMVQGGGLGIFGDFLFAETNRFGGGFAETVAGPVVGLANDVWSASIGNVRELGEGKSVEDVNAVSDMLGLMERYNPVPGFNSWYGKLATKRVFHDQLRKMLTGEDAEARFERQERSAKRDYGQDYWWEPGDVSPAE